MVGESHDLGAELLKLSVIAEAEIDHGDRIAVCL